MTYLNLRMCFYFMCCIGLAQQTTMCSNHLTDISKPEVLLGLFDNKQLWLACNKYTIPIFTQKQANCGIIPIFLYTLDTKTFISLNILSFYLLKQVYDRIVIKIYLQYNILPQNIFTKNTNLKFNHWASTYCASSFSSSVFFLTEARQFNSHNFKMQVYKVGFYFRPLRPSLKL